MPDAVASLPVEGLGIVFVIVSIGMMVYKGLLTPRSVMQDLIQSREDRIKELATERDKWENAANTALEALRTQGEQNGELMELARTTDAFIRSLPRAGGRPR